MDLKSRTIPRSRPRPIIIINTTLMASMVWVLVGLTFIQNAKAASLPKPMKSTHSLTTTADKNETHSTHSTSRSTTFSMKPSGMALRALYVISAVSAVVVVYLIGRAICARRRKSRTRRYGMLHNESGNDMEMRPLSEHEDTDDDSMTLFDASKRNGKR